MYEGINEYKDEYQLELSDSIDNQVINLNNLGSNYIIEPNIVSQEIWINILTHYNNNYGTIINLDYILLNQESISKMGSFLYRFIVIDLLGFILPRTAKNAGLKDVRDLTFFSPPQLKSHIMNVIISKITILNNIKNQISNIDVYNESLKYTFYMDLVDADFDTLFNNLIQPIINKYEPEINNLVKEA